MHYLNLNFSLTCKLGIHAHTHTHTHTHKTPIDVMAKMFVPGTAVSIGVPGTAVSIGATLLKLMTTDDMSSIASLLHQL